MRSPAKLARQAMTAMCFMGLLSPLLAAPRGATLPPPSVSTSVAVSTITLTDPSAISALKRQIETDQQDILRARAALKKAKARAGRDPEGARKAEETWRQVREKLKEDRKLLRRAIELQEPEPDRRGAAGRSKKRG